MFSQPVLARRFPMVRSVNDLTFALAVQSRYDREMKKSLSRPDYIFETIAALFVTTLILSNIASVKSVQIGAAVFDAGTILFPLSYIIGDVVTEIYGFRRMRTLLFIGAAMLVLMSVIFWVVGILPPPASWNMQSQYESILGVVWRISLSSIVAILCGELLNSYVLSKLKIKFEGRKLWGRIVGSTAIGALVDTLIFSLLAFTGMMPFGVLVQLMITVYCIKVGTQIVVSPITLRVINWIKRRENLDVYEQPSWR